MNLGAASKRAKELLREARQIAEQRTRPSYIVVPVDLDTLDPERRAYVDWCLALDPPIKVYVGIDESLI